MGANNTKAKETQIEYDRLGLVSISEVDDTQSGEKISFMELSRRL